MKEPIRLINFNKAKLKKFKLKDIKKSGFNNLKKIFNFIIFNNKFIKNIKKNDLGLVIIFTSIFLFALYFYGIGRNRYYVRSDVIVRKVGSGTASAGGSLLGLLGGGNISATEDARFLKVYLESPQILKKIDDRFEFDKAYSKNNFDFFCRLKKKFK